MNNLDGVMVIGLTGQTGSGKTTACRIFRDNGFAVINADEVARMIMDPGSVCLKEVADCFGSHILNEDMSLNRQKLADIVFNNPKKLELLNSISYPHITSEILALIRENSSKGNKLILLDAPTLFESRADDFCEIIISVIADENMRLRRIMERDGLTEEQALSRMKSQHNEKFFVDNSDFIIKNNDGINGLDDIVNEMSAKIKSYYINKFKDLE
ncbi:MAG: dephospho-CoA kinase [Oscillospiraceae bacterium]|nr:dephospho-CoA kinase [Oscillospiraceae bacterium]MDD6082859.1 dephospho-CoA kinase [Oscillospiraceae bacterium]